MRKVLTITYTLLLLTACKKNETAAPTGPQGSRLELSLDSLYLYARETYLWYEQLPAYASFAPRQYATPGGGLASLTAALKAITRLAVNPLTQQPYEFREGHPLPLYSYIAEGNIITGQQGTVNLDGQGNDLGLGLAIVSDTAVYVSYVEQGSPAAAAGITRGMRLTHVEGDPVQANSTALSNLLNSPVLTLRLLQQDGSPLTHTLAAQPYTASPVLASAIINMPGKKIGYVALARFSELATAQASLEAAFAPFSHENITSLVIDLRYNAGGYVQTAEYVADLIAPTSINGAVMYSEHFNVLLQQGRAPILKTISYLDKNRQPVYINGRKATYADIDYSVAGNTYRFSKKGGLSGIKSMVFIVSGRTASASELLINSFKPYLDVKLVGSPTYGKPVGFFGIGIDAYTVYLSQFRLLNAAGQGDYYNGMPCDITAADDVRYNFGDPQESCMARALEYISGSGPRRSNEAGAQDAAIRVYPIEKAQFYGVVEQRMKLKHTPD